MKKRSLSQQYWHTENRKK